MSKLHKSWVKHYYNHYNGNLFLNGANHFQRNSIRELENLYSSQEGLTTQKALSKAIEIIKNLKA